MINIIVYVSAAVLVVAGLILQALKMVKEITRQKIKIASVKSDLFIVKDKSEEYRKRVIDLEDSIKEGYSVKVRKEVTVVDSQFTMDELYQTKLQP